MWSLTAQKGAVQMAGQSVNERPSFKGEILLCDDNEINRFVIKSHLTRLGLDVTTANDGKEGVDIVSGRIKNCEKPFDLIFMDIYMPVMGGLEAAEALARFGNQAPIIALTADAALNDREIYGVHGMAGFLNKPVVTEELWSCLYQYFTPVGFVAVNETERADDEAKQRQRLLTSFVKKNQTTHRDISAAIEAGDIKLAHRLAHNLRGLAGLMGKTALQEAARAVEDSLAKADMERIKEQMQALGPELKAILDELLPLLHEQEAQAAGNTALDKAKAVGVLEKLEPLLCGDSAACLDFVDELREIPGTGELIGQIEDYEFEMALEILAGLKKSWGA